MSENLEKLKDRLLALVDGEPMGEDTDANDEGSTLMAAAKSLPTNFLEPAWSFADGAAPTLPTRIGPYRIIDLLGAGGMGVVYRAQSPSLDRQVAVKVLRPGLASKAGVTRFEFERSALARMDHPNIAAVLDTGVCSPDHLSDPAPSDRPRSSITDEGADGHPSEDRHPSEDGRGRYGGQPYVVVELIDGSCITEYVRERKLGLDEILDLFVAVCKGVSHAHACGVIHRDLKPSNVLIIERDGLPVPKIIDFGIARILDAQTQERVTMTDQVLGTLEYISPEVIENGATVADARSDVYALGAMLYELMTGVAAVDLSEPRRHGLLAALQAAHDAVIVKPSERVVECGDGRVRKREIGPDLDCVILHALHEDPQHRYQSPSDLAADIKRYQSHQPILAHPPSKRTVFAKFVRRNRLVVAAACVVFVSLLGGLTATWIAYQESERSRSIAVNAKDDSDKAIELLSEAALLVDYRDPRRKAKFANLGERIETVLADPAFQSPHVKFRLQFLLARAYTGEGKFAEARNILEQAYLSTNEEWALPNERFLALISLAESLGDHREFAASRRYAEQAVAQARSNRNPSQIAEAEYALANTLTMDGEFAEASKIYERLISTSIPDPGFDSQLSRAKAQVMYGTILVQTGRKREAEPYSREGFETHRQRLGMSNSQTLMAGHNLATVLSMLGRKEEAIEIFEPILAARRAVLGDDHRDTLMSAAMLANSLVSVNRIPEAESLYVHTLKLGDAAYQDQNPAGSTVSAGLAKLQEKAGDYKAAIQSTEKAIRYAEATYGVDDWHVEVYRCRLARLYTVSGDPNRALPLAANAYKILATAAGESHPYAIAAAKYTASAYRSLGDEDQSRHWMRLATAGRNDQTARP